MRGLLLLVGCGGQTTTDPMMDASTFPDSSPVIDASVPKKDASITDASVPDVSQPKDYCPMNAMFDIIISGNGAMFEGKRVQLAAIENDPMAMTVYRRLLVTGKIVNGALSLSCPKSLSTNNYYPSWAVFVDVDGDGTCSSADFAMQQQLFGWMMNITYSIQSNEWVSVSTLKPPIGSKAPDFCIGYF